MKNIFLTAIFLGGILIMPGCSARNLTFTVKSCLPGIDPYKGPRAEILSAKREGNSLTVRGFVKTYCGGAKIKGSYTVRDNTLFLAWSVSKSTAVTRCLCAYGVTWRIEKLPPHELTVKLAE